MSEHYKYWLSSTPIEAKDIIAQTLEGVADVCIKEAGEDSTYVRDYAAASLYAYLFNAGKYYLRLGKKGGLNEMVQDIDKCVDYLLWAKQELKMLYYVGEGECDERQASEENAKSS